MITQLQLINIIIIIHLHFFIYLRTQLFIFTSPSLTPFPTYFSVIYSLLLTTPNGLYTPGTYFPFPVSPTTFTVWNKSSFLYVKLSSHSSVGIATRYRPDDPGIESQWRRDFAHPSRSALGPSQPPIQRAPGLFPGGKAEGEWRWPPTPHLAPRLKKE